MHLVRRLGFDKLVQDGMAFPDVEIEVHYGGQPIYYYVISVE